LSTDNWIYQQWLIRKGKEHEEIPFRTWFGEYPLEVKVMKIDINNLQAIVKEWTDHNFPTALPWQPLVGAMEELGELSHAHLKEFQGIRNKNFKEAKEDSIGDIIVFLADYCNRNGLELSHCVEVAWDTASKRDWIKYPSDGLYI
jgi:NTP pyrophosphatase (non-canonical NTP hydrolase)